MISGYVSRCPGLLSVFETEGWRFEPVRARQSTNWKATIFIATFETGFRRTREHKRLKLPEAALKVPENARNISAAAPGRSDVAAAQPS
jgi:hypothetical protein